LILSGNDNPPAFGDLDLQAGERVRWQLPARSELRLIRLEPPPTKKRLKKKSEVFQQNRNYGFDPLNVPSPRGHTIAKFINFSPSVRSCKTAICGNSTSLTPPTRTPIGNAITV
jgi:hypothetical protein